MIIKRKRPTAHECVAVNALQIRHDITFLSLAIMIQHASVRFHLPLFVSAEIIRAAKQFSIHRPKQLNILCPILKLCSQETLKSSTK